MKVGRSWRHAVAWVVAILVSLAVFSLYLHPDFVIGYAGLVFVCQ